MDYCSVQIMLSPKLRAASLAALVAFLSLHDVRPVIDSIIPLAQANRGLARMEAGAHFGKIVVQM